MLRSVFDVPLSMLAHIPQVPRAPTSIQSEGHREDISPLVRGVAGLGRAKDPRHFDAASQGVP